MLKSHHAAHLGLATRGEAYLRARAAISFNYRRLGAITEGEHIMPQRPWYPFYPSDYMGDTAHLSPLEDCLYRRLLDLHWMHGTLPIDEDRLAKLVRYSKADFDACWPEVRRYFRRYGDSLIQPRMHSHVLGVRRQRLKNSLAGKASAAKRLGNDRSPGVQPPYPDPYPDPEKEERDPPKTGDENSSSGSLFGEPEETKPRAANGSRFRPPSLQEVEEYIAGKGYSVDAEQFLSFYSAKGWMIGKNKMKCWHSAISTWQRRQPSGGNGKVEMEGL